MEMEMKMKGENNGSGEEMIIWQYTFVLTHQVEIQINTQSVIVVAFIDVAAQIIATSSRGNHIPHIDRNRGWQWFVAAPSTHHWRRDGAVLLTRYQ